MFGKKNKPTIDLQDDKERKALELAALEASLDFLKRPAKPAEDEGQADGEGAPKEITAADRARAQKFGRRMDYKTAVVKRGSENEAADNAAESVAEDKETKEEVKAEAAAGTEETAAVEAVTEASAETVEDKAAAPDESETVTDAAAENSENEAAEEKAEEVKEETAFSEKETGVPEAGEVKEETEEEQKSGLIIAEAPVPDTGEEEEESPKLIDNPLPTPKKHVPKEMDFDIEPDADHMHFDVVDMKGKDYFDIN